MTNQNSKAQWYGDGFIEGWCTVGTYEGELVIYGGFSTREEAEVWLKQLVSGEIHPVRSPAYSRG